MTDSSSTDLDLISNIARQDPVSLRALYDRYGRLSFALAYRMTSDAAAAEEIVQDAFVSVWNRAHQFDTGKGGNVRSWLMRIVHNRSIDHRRREIDKGPGRAPIERAEQELSSPDVWHEVSANLDAEDVRSAMRELPFEQRRSIELSFFEGMSHAEIAAQENESLGTVKGRIRLGLNKLSTSLRASAEASGSLS